MAATDEQNHGQSLETHVGICDCAQQLGLTDHLVHFASQALKVCESNDNRKEFEPNILHKRAKAYCQQHKFEEA